MWCVCVYQKKKNPPPRGFLLPTMMLRTKSPFFFFSIIILYCVRVYSYACEIQTCDDCGLEIRTIRRVVRAPEYETNQQQQQQQRYCTRNAICACFLHTAENSAKTYRWNSEGKKIMKKPPREMITRDDNVHRNVGRVEKKNV